MTNFISSHDDTQFNQIVEENLSLKQSIKQKNDELDECHEQIQKLNEQITKLQKPNKLSQPITSPILKHDTSTNAFAYLTATIPVVIQDEFNKSEHKLILNLLINTYVETIANMKQIKEALISLDKFKRKCYEDVDIHCKSMIKYTKQARIELLDQVEELRKKKTQLLQKQLNSIETRHKIVIKTINECRSVLKLNLSSSMKLISISNIIKKNKLNEYANIYENYDRLNPQLCADFDSELLPRCIQVGCNKKNTFEPVRKEGKIIVNISKHTVQQMVVEYWFRVLINTQTIKDVATLIHKYLPPFDVIVDDRFDHVVSELVITNNGTVLEKYGGRYGWYCAYGSLICCAGNKYRWHFRVSESVSMFIGIIENDKFRKNWWKSQYGYSYSSHGQIKPGGILYDGGAYGAEDCICMNLDLINNTLSFAKNDHPFSVQLDVKENIKYRMAIGTFLYSNAKCIKLVASKKMQITSLQLCTNWY